MQNLLGGLLGNLESAGLQGHDGGLLGKPIPIASFNEVPVGAPFHWEGDATNPAQVFTKLSNSYATPLSGGRPRMFPQDMAVKILVGPK